MKKIILTLLFATLHQAQASDFGVNGIGPYSDSGIHGPKYAELVKSFEALAQKHPQYLDFINYGQTIKGRPLVALKLTKKWAHFEKSASEAGKLVTIAGSIHGNEYLNIEDRLPEWFVTEGLNDVNVKLFLEQNGAILFAPILNPDGYDARDRENAHGVDLNRDFTVMKKNHIGFEEPETKALSEMITQEVSTGRKLRITMDYHCCIGAVLRPWSFRAPNPPQMDLDRFAVVGRILKSTFGNDYKYGTTPDILGYEAVGTSKDYYYESFGAVGLTFEGKYKQENKRFVEHTRMWKQIFEAIILGKI